MEHDFARVVGDGGIRGVVAGPSENAPDEIAIQLEDGSEISVPSSAFVRQPDGTWYVHTDHPGTFRELRREPGEETVIPVISEELEVGKRKRPTGKVRVEKGVAEHDESVSMPLTRERAEVRRVLVDKPVDAPPPVRREGDTIILPIVEEVAVVEKRLVLKEELHIRRHRTTEQHEETVKLKNEYADVRRLDAEGRPLTDEERGNTDPEPAHSDVRERLLEPGPRTKMVPIRKKR